MNENNRKYLLHYLDTLKFKVTSPKYLAEISSSIPIQASGYLKFLLKDEIENNPNCISEIGNLVIQSVMRAYNIQKLSLGTEEQKPTKPPRFSTRPTRILSEDEVDALLEASTISESLVDELDSLLVLPKSFEEKQPTSETVVFCIGDYLNHYPIDIQKQIVSSLDAKINPKPDKNSFRDDSKVFASFYEGIHTFLENKSSNYIMGFLASKCNTMRLESNSLPYYFYTAVNSYFSEKVKNFVCPKNEFEDTFAQLKDFFNYSDKTENVVKHIVFMTFLEKNYVDVFSAYVSCFESPYNFSSRQLRTLVDLVGSESEVLSTLNPIFSLSIFNNYSRTFSTESNSYFGQIYLSPMLSKLFNSFDFDEFLGHFFTKYDVSSILPLNDFNVNEKEIKLIQKLINKGGNCQIVIKTQTGSGSEEFVASLAESCGKTVLEPIYSTIRDLEGELYRSSLFTVICDYACRKGFAVYNSNFPDVLISREARHPDYNILDVYTIPNFIKNISEKELTVFHQMPDLPFNQSIIEHITSTIKFGSLSMIQRRLIWSNLLKHFGLAHFELDIKTYSKLFTLNRFHIKSAIKQTLDFFQGQLLSKNEFIEILESNLNAKNVLLGKKEVIFNKGRYSIKGLSTNINIDEVVEGARKYYSGLTSKSILKGEASYNILIHGSAGTGKTEFAKYLADEIDAEIIELKASDLIQPMLSWTLQAIANQFKKAESQKAVLLIDEADSLFCDRYDPSTSEDKKTITNELLTQMESFHGIFICSTNMKKSLDPASLRRFTQKLKFNYLSLEGRIHFYSVFLGQLNSEELTPEDLENLGLLKMLSIGDFKTVLQKNQFLTKTFTHKELIADLKFEMMEKLKQTGSRIIPVDNSKYDLSIINSNADLERMIRQGKNFYKMLMEAGEKPIEIPNRNMLFYGVAGSGKTELAKYFAQQIKAPLLVKKASDFASKYVGETLQNIKKAFDEAEENGAVLLIDEADSLIKNRASGSISEHSHENTNEFLTQLENFKGICILSTNFKESFDDATLRRLAYKIEFGFINNEAKVKLFNLYLKDLSGIELTAEDTQKLLKVDYLTAGNFKTVFNQLFFDKGADFLTNAYLIETLANEVKHKKKTPIGFGSN